MYIKSPPINYKKLLVYISVAIFVAEGGDTLFPIVAFPVWEVVTVFNPIVAFSSSGQTPPKDNFTSKIAIMAMLSFLFPKSSSILFGSPI
jgi:hypothetical protein